MLIIFIACTFGMVIGIMTTADLVSDNRDKIQIIIASTVTSGIALIWITSAYLILF